jgi:signal transduction histidine kinase
VRRPLGSLRSRLTLAGTAVGAAVVVGVSAIATAAERADVALAVLLPVLLVVVGAGCWLLVGAVLRPVHRLADEATRLSVDEPGGRLPVPSADSEVAVLTRSLNALLERVEQSVERERTFVDDASHELRTPLTVLRGELELAELDLASDDPKAVDRARASVQAARSETERLTRLASDLLVLARLDRGELPLRKQAVNLHRLATEVCERFGLPASAVTGDNVLVNADPDRLDQVLTNLVANAKRHARVRVRVTVRDLGMDGAELEVADDGRGFPERLLPGAFERFTRADAARGRMLGTPGTGLGLAITAAVMSAHGGSARATNGPPLGGAVVTLRLPLR